MTPSRVRRDLAYRRRRREQAHQDALADGTAATPSKIPDHPLIPAGEPKMLTSSEALEDFLAHARELGSFAYDTEFIGELSYFPRTCLIQLATSQRIALLDPFEDITLDALWAALADPDLETIVHAGQQDLQPVMRFLDKTPANIFDTQIVAAFVGNPYPISLRKLVEETAGVRLGKGMTFTHWDERPLSAHHLAYAADDVRYLPRIREAMREQLEELGHTAWAAEECRKLENPVLYRFDPDTQYLKVKGAQSLDNRRLTVVRELVIMRDELAREHDLPPKTLLKDDVLVRLAREKIKVVTDLDKVRGLPRPLVKGHGSLLVDTIARGRKAPTVKRPSGSREEETARDRVLADAIIAVTSAWCIGHGVDPGLVANRADLARLLRWARKGCTEAKRPRFLEGWRQELLGEPIRRFLTGDESLRLTWTDDDLRVDGEPARDD